MKSMRLACLRLDSRYNISLFDRTLSAHKARTERTPRCACSISGYFPPVSDCIYRLATARERTSSFMKVDRSDHVVVSSSLLMTYSHRPQTVSNYMKIVPKIAFTSSRDAKTFGDPRYGSDDDLI